VAAYQYIANAYIAELYLGWTEDAEADIENLLEAAGRAIALSPGDSLSQGLYGGGLALSGDHDGALACVRRATALNANSVNVLGPCGTVLSLAGEAREANEMIDRMLRLTPAHYYRAGFLATMSINHLRLGEPERGLPLASEALKLKPDAPSCHLVHAEILRATGRSDAAKVSIAKAYQVRPDLNEALVRAIFPYRDRSIPNRLVTLLGMN
jgi:tetratricopeptide (TPR) repeat protein